MLGPTRNLIFAAALAASAAALAACGPAASENGQRPANGNTAASPSGAAFSNANRAELPPVTSAHGGAPAAPPAGAPAAPPAGGKPDTAALDAKIERAEAKAKGAGASDADKKAAAAAYIERGNVYYLAQSPQLYRYALGDFRRALRLDPANAEARQKADQIVAIYESMGRPVPTNGLEDQ